MWTSGVRMTVGRCVRNLAPGALIGRHAGVARAASADDFVAAIYAAHVGPNEGFTLDTDADFRRYFEPTLAVRMVRAAHLASEKHDRAWLDYDAVVDAKACGRKRRHIGPRFETCRCATLLTMGRSGKAY